MVLVRAHHRPHHGSIVRYRSPAMQTTSHARAIRQVRGAATSDGAGVKLTRVIGGPALPEPDPLLLLDEFVTDQAEDYIDGFPSHSTEEYTSEFQSISPCSYAWFCWKQNNEQYTIDLKV